ncbi:hypothetical protein [uncultured Mucilaginibacter sp.]|uniref:hypothetical protein n=1 Tax=uncultured Mucilaginibacter sp. TaxID=797541 RepID=UPI0025D4B275|nr:hypothetical protein [uncultured Mucilaginibacter sp.]
MPVTLELYELSNLLTDAAELGAKQMSIAAGLTPPFYSASQAYKLYGRKLVERWVEENLIKPCKDGDRNHNLRYDSLRLEALAKSSNRIAYFTNIEKRNAA